VRLGDPREESALSFEERLPRRVIRIERSDPAQIAGWTLKMTAVYAVQAWSTCMR
jgi:hypothetical protein